MALDVIFAGSGEFGLPTLRALLAARHRVVRVFSQPDRPAGRGGKLTPTPITQFALAENLALARTENINVELLPPADVMIVVAFGQKIADAVVYHPRMGSLNLHASILPKYRGAAPINWAIMNGETITGNSIIRLAQKMDAGAVLAQSQVPIGELETAGELHNRLAADGAPLVLRVIEELAAGKAVERPQDESLATLAPKLSREWARLDWRRPAAELARQIRGLYPWPGCRARLIDPSGKETDRVILARAVPPVPSPAEAKGAAGAASAAVVLPPAAKAAPTGHSPGTIDDLGHIATADGMGLEVVELQPEGKRPMPLSAYRNGHPWHAGMKLESL